MTRDLDSLRELDYRHLWHPYTDIATHEKAPFHCVVRGEGSYLYEADGTALLDGIASWWCIALGHGYAPVIDAIREQAGQLQHCILGSLAHPPAIELAQRLAALAPGDLNRVYFAADGSSAVEAAMKMAVQHWQFRGEPQRTRFISLEQAYHGDTLGAISAGYIDWFQKPFADLVKPAIAAPTPHTPSGDEETCLRAAHAAFKKLQAIVDEHADELAAVIVEPLVQGSAGIWIYPEEYLQSLRNLCDDYGILLIADEIATGLGRTGAMFACDRAGIVPDIMCLGKALTAGYLPLSATIATDAVYEAFRSTDGVPRVFWDGHTFCGNPITCAAGLATLDAYEKLDIPRSCAPREAMLAERFAAIAQLPGVAYHKTLGMIGMCALDEASGGAARAKRAALIARELGLFTRPLGTTLYLWPPLTVTEEELGLMLDRLEAAIVKSMQ
ncbi:MAG: adenosylmethionine--8-amino-7-oxononanoate transaminase [Candidatus Hydrogenedens sp.]|nr:adenosylmethionine--8-amino-7-oxononanoate transaminase [Candidatus Hydrogenedens sp.]